MPIKIQSDLPVKEILEKENIFVMDETRAIHQDIRPIQILILNLMPLKEETELQLTYGKENVQFSEYLKELSRCIDEQTREKIAKEGV